MELTVLGADSVKHRPAMRGYTAFTLRLAQRAGAAGLIASSVLWAATEPALRERTWDPGSSVALAAAATRCERLAGRDTGDLPPRAAAPRRAALLH